MGDLHRAQLNQSDPVPETGRLLGVDFGTKRVGIAISTADQTIASPLDLFVRQNPQLDGRHFLTLIEEYQVKAIILGLPIHLDGSESIKSKESRKYGRWLRQLTGLPVRFWDERVTSVAAEDFLLAANLTREQRKKRIDMVAAQIILQSFIESRTRPTEPRTG